MRNILLAAALSAAALMAGTPRLVIDSQKVAGGEIIVQLSNVSEWAVTAYTVGASETESTSADALLGARNGRAVGPGETVEARIPTARADAPVRVMAALFEDGAREGDARSLQDLFTARQEIYRQLPQALALLRLAAAQNYSASAAAFWFHQWQERWQTPDRTRVISVPMAAEMFLKRMGGQPAEGPARELIQVFEELSAKLAQSKPAL